MLPTFVVADYYADAAIFAHICYIRYFDVYAYYDTLLLATLLPTYCRIHC